MFREMRRKEREASKDEAMKLLMDGEYGVLATTDSSSMPYAVPISYVYLDDCIYLHCAKVGHKLDNIASNNKVSFCVVGNTKVLPDKFSTVYKSTIVFGTASIVENIDEKNKALHGFIDKYSPHFQQSGNEYIDKAAGAATVIKIIIDHMSGKSRPE